MKLCLLIRWYEKEKKDRFSKKIQYSSNIPWR